MTKVNIKKLLILTLNITFYCFLDLKSLPILLLMILVSHFCINRNQKSEKNIWLILNISLITLTWIFYKSIINYSPIGMSFYSFKIISTIVDCFKNKQRYSLFDYSIYVTYFPQILSGPISRSEDIISQLDNSFTFKKDNIKKGILLIISGLFLKMVIANRASIYVNNVFGDYLNKPALALWLAAFLYTIQIYTDFAGYSNISIGISNIIGIDCRKNFDRPYFSKSVKEFWNRWHISLSTWLRDYIYIPLGGNRKGKIRKYINIMITFLISGFWHGNGSGYIFWGAYHGALTNVNPRKSNKKINNLFYVIITFILVMFGCIFFRLENITTAFEYIKLMFINIKINFNSIVQTILPFTSDNSSISMFIILFIFIISELIFELIYKDDNSNKMFRYAFYIIAIVLFGIFKNSGFIYMNY